MVSMPTTIKKEYKQMRLTCIRSANLPKMDRFGTVDAYCKVVFTGKTLKTKYITAEKKSQGSVQWDETMMIPIQWPLSSNRLVVNIVDYDAIGSDEIIGSIIFELKKLVLEC